MCKDGGLNRRVTIPGATQKFTGLQQLSETYTRTPESKYTNVQHLLRGLQDKMTNDREFVQSVLRNDSRSYQKVSLILEGRGKVDRMKNGRSPEQRRYRACFERGEWVSGVYSYDLLPSLRRGQFCVVITDNVLPLWDAVEDGHHWLTVCREKDHVLVFDSFGRSLEQMEQNYTEPKLKQFFVDAFLDCRISTYTQVKQDRSTAV